MTTASTWLIFLKEFHISLGFEQAKNVVHYDYDGNTPTPYYALDKRGGKLQDYLDKIIASLGFEDHTKQQDKGMAKLSEREKEVLGLLLNGYTNKEIAADLYITEVTVKKHVTAE